MSKTLNLEKAAARIVNDFLEEEVDTSSNPNRYEELVQRLDEYADSHCENEGVDWRLEALKSKLQGALIRRSKDVGRDEQGNLFHEEYMDRHGITTSEGYIANRYATPEHLQEKLAQLEMRVEKAKENKALHVERVQVVQPGFDHGAQNLGEAVAIALGETHAKEQKPASSVLAAEGQGFGARAG